MRKNAKAERNPEPPVLVLMRSRSWQVLFGPKTGKNTPLLIVQIDQTCPENTEKSVEF